MAQRSSPPDPAAAQGQPAPEAHVQLRFEKFSSFVEEYWPKISLRGMLLETNDPKPVGTMVSFEFKLTDGFRLCQGVGEVAWVRRHDEGPQRPAGMGIRFHALDDQGRELILKILEEQVKSGGEPFEIERIPPGAEGEAVQAIPPPESAAPKPRAAAERGVPPPPSPAKEPFAAKPSAAAPAPVAAAAAEPDFKAPWGEKLREPSEVLDPLEDSSVSAASGMEDNPDADSALVGFPIEQEAAESELKLADDEELLLFSSELEEEPDLEAGGEPGGPAAEVSFDLDEPSPELDSPNENLWSELVEADQPDSPAVDLTGEEPTVLLSKIDALTENETPPSIDSEAEIEFDAESSATLLEITGSAEEPTTAPWEDVGASDEALAAASPAIDEYGEDTAGEPGPRAAEQRVPAQPVLPEPESQPFPEVDLPAAPAAELSWEPESAAAELEVPAAPAAELPWEPESPAAELEVPAAPAAELPWEPESAAAELEVSPAPEAASSEEPEYPLPAAELELPPPSAAAAPAGPESSPAAEEGAATAAPATAASSFLDRTADLLPAEEVPEEEWEEEGESGPRLFLRDIRLAMAESGTRIVVLVVILSLAVAGYLWQDKILRMVGLSSQPTTTEVTEAPLETSPAREAPEPAAAAGPEPSAEEQPLLASSGAEETVPEPEYSESPPATPVPAREPPPREPEQRPRRTSAATPATRVTRIAHRETPAGTLVTIYLDGDLAAGRYEHNALGYDPLKEQLTLHGIEEPYRSQVPVGTNELRQIRLGFHPGKELKLVFDLGSAGMTLADIRTRGDRLEVLVSGR